MATTQVVEHGSRWRIFAAVLILLVGAFNFIDGIVAIANPHYYYYYISVSGQPATVTHHLVFGDLTAWGWTILILGVIQVLVALAIFTGRHWAAYVGIAIACLNAIGQLMFIGVYPWWSVIAIVIDIIVVYALVMYGFPERA